jgi:hypothetical protein
MVTRIFDVPTLGDYTQIAGLEVAPERLRSQDRGPHIFIYNIVHSGEDYGG